MHDGLYRTARLTSGKPAHPVSEVQLAFRAGTAAGIPLALAQLFKLQYPIYARIAAAIVIDLVHSKTSQLGLQRVVTTVGGALCGGSLRQLLAARTRGTGCSIFVAMLLCSLLKPENGAPIVRNNTGNRSRLGDQFHSEAVRGLRIRKGGRFRQGLISNPAATLVASPAVACDILTLGPYGRN